MLQNDAQATVQLPDILPRSFQVSVCQIAWGDARHPIYCLWLQTQRHRPSPHLGPSLLTALALGTLSDALTRPTQRCCCKAPPPDI